MLLVQISLLTRNVSFSYTILIRINLLLPHVELFVHRSAMLFGKAEWEVYT